MNPLPSPAHPASDRSKMTLPAIEEPGCPAHNERYHECSGALFVTVAIRSAREVCNAEREARRTVCGDRLGRWMHWYRVGQRAGERRRHCPIPLRRLPRGREAGGGREARRGVDRRAARVVRWPGLVPRPPRDRIGPDASRGRGAAHRRGAGHGREMDPRRSGLARAAAPEANRPEPVASALPRGIRQHDLRPLRVPPAGEHRPARGRPRGRLPEGGPGPAPLRGERRWHHAARRPDHGAAPQAAARRAAAIQAVQGPREQRLERVVPATRRRDACLVQFKPRVGPARRRALRHARPPQDPAGGLRLPDR